MDEVTMPVAVTATKLAVTPNQAMLDDPGTNFPVYIDPGFTSGRAGFALAASAAPNTAYWNSSYDAMIGTYDGGANKWRTFFNYTTAGTAIQGKHIISSTLHLYEKWSQTCTPSQFQIYAMASGATAVTTWNNQAAWSQMITSQTVAKGYSTAGIGGASSCPAGEVQMPVTTTTQAAADSGATLALGLRATSETDSNGWKRFSNNPTLGVVYTAYPTVGARATVPATPATPCPVGTARPFINTKTPTLKAVINDAEGATVRSEFDWWVTGGAKVGGANSPSAAAGSNLSVNVPSGQLVEGGIYSWRVRGFDSVVWGDWSTWCQFAIDTIAPTAAATVASTAYPAGVWAGKAGTAGTFTVGANGTTDVASYVYGLDSNPPTTVVSAPSLGAAASVSITPLTDGPHTLYVEARDRAGNRSPITTYTFNVGVGAVTSPKPGDMSTGKNSLESAAQPSATAVTYQWRRGDADIWTTIPAGDVSLAAGGGAVTWPMATTGSGAFPKLNWNSDSTVKAGPDALDGPLQVQATFTGTPVPTTSAVTFNLDRNRASAATTDVGAGSVNLITGNLTVAESDVSEDSFGSDLTVSRIYNSRQAGGNDPMFGPGWVSSVTSDESAAYTGLTVTGSLVQAKLPDGEKIAFAKKATTGTGATFNAQPGLEDLTLTYTTTGDNYAIQDLDGTVVTFTRPTGTPAGTYLPTVVDAPGAGKTTLSWETVTIGGVVVSRPTGVLAPVPAGVSCPTTAPVNAGCRSLAFTYATSTTSGTTDTVWGDYIGRLSQVTFKAYNPASSTTATTVMARYAYDNTGRLRMGWDPRLDNGATHLGDAYTYDTDGVLTQIKPTGQEPCQFGYTTVPGDTGKGRLATVTRSTLTASPATTTIVYRVPTTGAGAPYDLSAAQTSRWGQNEQPVDASAVFPPTQLPDGNQAAGVLPGSNGFERATVTYLNANAGTVNTVAPGGGTTAAAYDQWGNTVRMITPGNIRHALDAADGDTATDEAAAAERLSTVSIYSTDGRQLLETFGPEHDVTLPDASTVRGRAHSVTRYDENATAGGPYHLPTTHTISVRYTTSNGQAADADDRTTKTAYDWTLRQPTAVTIDPDGLALTTRTAYDPATGLLTATTTPGGGASNITPYTIRNFYYRFGTGSGYTECDNHPEWANLPCRIQPGGQAATGPELPVTVTKYDMYNQPTTEVEKISTGELRTTTTSYDTAGRVYETAVTTTIAAVPPAVGLGDAVPTIRNIYNAETGTLSATRSVVAGVETAATEYTYDTLGRQETYTDADGNTTTTGYDEVGRAATTNDGKFDRTTSYDGSTERRGLPTSVADPLRGTFTAEYNIDRKPIRETWPNGIEVTRTYDETGTQASITYTQPGCGQPDCTIYTTAAAKNIHSQQRTLTANAITGDQKYNYDDAGRMTLTTDTTAAACTTRTYEFDNATNRTHQGAYAPGAGGVCQTDTAGTSKDYSYDTADRVTGGYVYDLLGRTTTLPAADTANPSGGDVAVAYHLTDLVKKITQGNRTTNYTLDVNGERIRSWTDNATGSTVTRRNHYSADSDSPSWTDEGDGTWTGAITSLTGMAGIRTTTGIDWKITNLHGDFVATIHNSDPGVTGTSRTDEYGNPSTGSASPVRYGWLGSNQRASDTPTGLALMGVRLYNSTTGRFLTVDPVYGGNATAYDYCSGDPVNCRDLDGKWGLENLAKWWDDHGDTVTAIATIVAFVAIPGLQQLAAAVAIGGAAVTAARAVYRKDYKRAASSLVDVIPGVGVLMKTRKIFKIIKRPKRCGARTAGSVGFVTAAPAFVSTKQQFDHTSVGAPSP